MLLYDDDDNKVVLDEDLANESNDPNELELFVLDEEKGLVRLSLPLGKVGYDVLVYDVNDRDDDGGESVDKVGILCIVEDDDNEGAFGVWNTNFKFAGTGTDLLWEIIN